MALIERFETFEAERDTVHDPIPAFFRAFEKDGRRYVQIETRGRAGRSMPGKVSQTIQLNEESAQELMKLLASNFPTSSGA